ncbi:MAG: hypothetical protein M1492_10635 [Gammaproteobacteria bacterium]|nr:hypothetical protein [Gammaproteobacteria bacterium]
MVQKLAERVPSMKLSAFGLPFLQGAAVGLPVQFVITIMPMRCSPWDWSLSAV